MYNNLTVMYLNLGTCSPRNFAILRELRRSFESSCGNIGGILGGSRKTRELDECYIFTKELVYPLKCVKVYHNNHDVHLGGGGWICVIITSIHLAVLYLSLGACSPKNFAT